MISWLGQPTHRSWLDAEFRRLVGFGRDVLHPVGGACHLDDHGRPSPERGVHTWITARMLHVHGLAAAAGLPGSGGRARALLAGLEGPLRDAARGGWHHHLGADGIPDVAPRSCYDHAFVLLGLSTAVTAEVEGADRLLDEATDVFERRFWDETAGRCVDEWSADWSEPAPYRGLNANMHAVEAMLAVSDVTGERVWLDRASRICELVVGLGRDHGGRLPEHFDEHWTPDLEYNRERPDDPFKPYGATVGHGLEWARLLLHVEASAGVERPDLLTTAQTLFDRAVQDGWAPDGRPGFAYTTDWEGRPVVTARMHWVAAEAVAAAAALHRRTGEERYLTAYRTWWDHIDDCFIDRAAGSWWHQLDEDLRPATGVWSGKPDLYHAVQATLLPRLGPAPSLARAVAEGGLR
ncbi:AGE family epimerase/isomerase [Nocardioides sambongensis]|uniref:AGE family epimerase/isomerase n=1 Tax=Nocardioides sambongensis TaxID=2589074 RepID=UPI0018C87A63|nr:AGE family epimerase/isomerase [Nocardioides sambongensis]